MPVGVQRFILKKEAQFLKVLNLRVTGAGNFLKEVKNEYEKIDRYSYSCRVIGRLGMRRLSSA